ncbi:MAG: hypothetical protein IKZ82_03600 [Clostridia bacterium]|nr:hypothetical protein [Clostridia bacterium]
MKKAMKTFIARSKSLLALILTILLTFGIVHSSLSALAETGSGGKALLEEAQKSTVTDGYYDYDGVFHPVEGVEQGETDTDFTAKMPIATIFII